EQYLALIPDYDAAAESIEGGIYVDDKTPFYIRQEDFMLSDGRSGSFFVVIYTETMSTYMRRALIEIAIFVALVLGLVSAFITIYMYRNFLRPLKALQEGTNRIKEGNLNEDVEIMANDEIGQVCQSFNEMRAKLKESVDDRMRQEEENRELINNISHDLRTPITAIKGYVEGLMDGVADTPEKMDKYIKTIYNKTNEMDVLINELSLYSKIDTNSIPYDFIKLKVSAYFNDCFTELAMDMEHSHVKVNYRNTCPDDTRVIADPEQLRRVINNIIVNAVKYNKKDERIIDITVKPYGFDQIYVGIKDNGDGISEEDLPRIFDRMYRTDASRNAQTGGSGLGLAIAKKIIEEHEGSIWAESKNGEGTLIAFTLNLVREGGNVYEQSSDH
ncbi:MAG: HAMP domain-containing histidine kinase, partial [Lachnospiraceae bacterium]|nr:HAMP domain-containing histidine kinase [Lachnospiraceae bacterium]